MKRVGILGGGQLALMLLDAIHKLGARAVVYDPDPQAPACLRAAVAVHGAWDDASALQRFFEECDVATYEWENVDSSSLEAFDACLCPSARVLAVTQDRLREKEFLRDAGLPHVSFLAVPDPWRGVSGKGEWMEFMETCPLRCIMKPARGGYDGKGQTFVPHLENANIPMSPGSRYVAEEVIDLDAEVSCIVARSPDGAEVTFPVLENIHTHCILDFTLLPSRLPQAVQDTVRDLALQTARALDVVGLLAVEFFVTRSRPVRSKVVEVNGWFVCVNELAPRPHNSGHVTRNACSMSQFDALARILLDVPLTEPRILAPGTFCMGNLLGDVWLSQGREELSLEAWRRHPAVIDVVLYGKAKPAPRRKMGHFVTHAADASTALAAARAFRDSLTA